MTVPVPSQLVYSDSGDGVTTTFSFPVRFLDKAEVVVLLRDVATGVDTKQVLGSDYTIAGSSWPTGGNIVFNTAPPVGTEVIRYRETAAKQVVDLANTQRNDAEAVETQLDRLAMVQQDQKQELARALKADIGEDGLTVERVAEGHFWKAGADGRMVDGGSAEDIINAQGYAAEAKDAQDAAEAAQQAAEQAVLDAEAEADRAQSYAAMLSADKVKFPTVAGLIADEVMSYTAGAGLIEVGAGDIIEAQGYRYEVAADDAADHHLETAGGVKLYVADNEICDEALGAKSDGTDSWDAIQAALAVGKALGRNVRFTGPRRLSKNVVIDQTYSGLSLIWDEGAVWKYLDGLDFASRSEASMIYFDVPTGETLRDFRLVRPLLDGNRDGITSSTGNDSSCGIDFRYTSAGSYENVKIIDPVCRNTRYQGISIAVPGVEIIRPFCAGNRWHGIGIADDNSDPYGEDKEVRIYDPVTIDNDGQGIDFSRGRTIVSGTWISRRNGLGLTGAGGGKFSVGCRYVNVDRAILEDNIGYGFRSTGAADDCVVIFGHLEIRRTQTDGTSQNPGQPLNISAGKRVSIDKLIIENHDPYDDTLNAAGIIGPEVYIGSLEMRDTDANAVVIISPNYKIDHLLIEDTYRQALNVGAGRGSINGGRIANSNKAGVAPSDAAAAIRFAGGGNAAANSHKLLNVVLEDDQTVPTQVVGILATQAAQVHVDGCHFGTGIAQHVRSASSGTKVTFGRANTGITTFVDGSHSGNGGTDTINMATNLTALSNAKYRGWHVPTSADASAAHHRSALNASFYQLKYDTELASGSDNVTLDYFAEEWIEVP